MNKCNLIKEIVDRHDPQGLLRMGAPKDEYDTITDNIIDHLENSKSKDDLLISVHAIFIYWFGLYVAGNKDHYVNMVSDLWKFKNEDHPRFFDPFETP